ncbi:MAG: hypothetical protein AAF938_22990, partial [Myxococcota bacterium]
MAPDSRAARRALLGVLCIAMGAVTSAQADDIVTPTSPSGVSKGPYFVGVDTTSAWVFVETLGPAQLSVRAEPELRLAEPDVNRVAAAEVMEVGRAEAATAEADAEVVGADASAPVGAEVAPNGTVSAREARVSTRPWREDGRVLGAIRLRGLRPDTAYTVRAGNATGTLRTAPVEAEQLSFIVYGDNRTQHQQHRAVVRAVAAEPNVRFILHTGDLVEMGGRATDWDTAFEISSELFRR